MSLENLVVTESKERAKKQSQVVMPEGHKSHEQLKRTLESKNWTLSYN
jgi:hypothetical protein